MIEPLRIEFDVACSPDHVAFHRGPRGTRVEIEHGGWDRLGVIGQAWRDANRAGWDGFLPAYSEAARTRSA